MMPTKQTTAASRLFTSPEQEIRALHDQLPGEASHPDVRSVHLRYRLALVHLQEWQLAAASEQACLALRAAAALPWPLATTRTTPPRFNSDLAGPLLLLTLTQLAHRDVVAFATGGTLLGLVREGRLLASDKDLDIATPIAHFPRAAQCLQEMGWEVARTPLVASNFCSFRHPASGISLDLIGSDYDARRQKIVGGWWPPGQAREAGRLLQFTPFSVELREQGGCRHWLVAEPETLLSEIFGPNWRMPDPESVSFFETPALVEHTPFNHLLGYLRLLEAWSSGRQSRFQRLLSALQRLDPDDRGLRPWLSRLPVAAPASALTQAPGADIAAQVAAGLRLALQQFAGNDIGAALSTLRQNAQQAARAALPPASPTATATIDTTLGLSLLTETLVNLAAAGIQAFAFGGALLGLVREGRLLVNDKDLDIVVPWAQFRSACSHLAQCGWRPAATAVCADNFRCFIHPQSGITLDVFGYDFQPGAVIGGWWPTGLPRQAGRLLRFSPFDLIQQASGQGVHWAIESPAPVLAELYGTGWQTPDPSFDATLETPALLAYNDYTRCWGLLRLLEAWTQGKPDLCRRRLRVLARLDPTEPLLTAFRQGPLFFGENPC